jgi:Transglutaminase-like superfamily
VKALNALLAMGAAFAAAVLLTPAARADAGSPPGRQTVAQRLRVELRKTRADLAQANARLASTRQSLAAAKKRVAALQARLDASSPVAVADEQVRREVAWAEHEDRASGVPYADGQLVALSAMNYVVGHVSTGAYGYLQSVGATLPFSNPGSVLTMQAGICGHATLTFAAVVRHFGYSVRSVRFYYSTPSGPDSHIAVEVLYGGGWHFFDPTFGLYWTDANGTALAITEVRAGKGEERKDVAIFTNVVEDLWWAGDDTAFETAPATTVVLGGQPF